MIASIIAYCLKFAVLSGVSASFYPGCVRRAELCLMKNNFALMRQNELMNKLKMSDDLPTFTILLVQMTLTPQVDDVTGVRDN